MSLGKNWGRERYALLKVVEALTEQGKTDEAIQVFKAEISEESKQYEKTVAIIATAMVKEGRLDDMKQFIEEVNPDHLEENKKRFIASHFISTVKELAAESKDPQKVRELADLLQEKKFVTENSELRLIRQKSGPQVA